MIAVEVVAEGPERPPAGAPVVVQLLDTTYADAPAQELATATASVEEGEQGALQRLELDATLEASGDYRVRAHVDVDGDGTVSPGDFVSTVAYPVQEGTTVQVVVKKV